MYVRAERRIKEAFGVSITTEAHHPEIRCCIGILEAVCIVQHFYLGGILLNKCERVVLHGVLPIQAELQLRLLLQLAGRGLLALFLNPLQLGLELSFVIIFVV